MQARCDARRAILCVGIALLLGGSAASAGERVLDDFFSTYVQRNEGVTRDAGDAAAANAATHVIDPWPPSAGQRRIPANGERMTGAIERYRDVRKLPQTPAPIAPVPIGVAGPSTPGAAPTGGGTAAR